MIVKFRCKNILINDLMLLLFIFTYDDIIAHVNDNFKGYII